jgi:hypothetical protein
VTEPQFTNWRKSTRSGGGSNCVEIAHTNDAVGMRDSKDRDGGVLVFSPMDWSSFIAGVRAGEFDLG